MSLTPQFGYYCTFRISSTSYVAILTIYNSTLAQEMILHSNTLPEIYEQEVERYGNRTLSGFLRMVGAEMPMTSDQVIWSEQNRLHVSYAGVAAGLDAGGAGATDNIIIGGGAQAHTNVISIN